jgi:hypothetical protein
MYIYTRLDMYIYIVTRKIMYYSVIITMNKRKHGNTEITQRAFS